MSFSRFTLFSVLLMLLASMTYITPRLDAAPAVDSYPTGDIVTNVTWGPGSSPYIINSIITISPIGSLTIMPGTEVRFGDDCGMIVEGVLEAGFDNGTVRFTGENGSAPGTWSGFIVRNGGEAVFEHANISGADTVFNLTGGRVTLRNSTMSSFSSTALLNMSSVMKVVNMTYDNSTVTFVDGSSRLETFAYVSFNVIDIHSLPLGDVEVDVMDVSSNNRISYMVNSTGEVPPHLLRGFTHSSGGVNRTTGEYSVIMSDFPFTHYLNTSVTVTGDRQQREILRFSWPPEMTNVPDRYFAYEDMLGVLQCSVLDRNEVGSVSVNISSGNVTYDAVHEELVFAYRNESKSHETVFINLTDGYDARSYAVNVTVVFRDDPPVFFIPRSIINVKENVPYVLGATIQDEDTPIEELVFTTDDPDNVSYDPKNSTFIFLYPDGTPSEFTVNLTISDGTTSVTRKVDVFFRAVNYPPYFRGPFPEIEIPEDTFIVLDMAPYMADPDIGDELELEMESGSYEIFSVSLLGTKLNISSLTDRNGYGRVLLTIRDRENLTDSEYLNVTITPVNDPPTLSYPDCNVSEGGAAAFEVIYRDIDGDIPLSMDLIMDGVSHNMSPFADDVLDPVNGIHYRITLELPSGTHNYSFHCSDGEFEELLGPFELNITETIETSYVEGFGGLVNVTVFFSGELSLVLVEDTVEEDLSGEDEVQICSFRLEGDPADILVMIIKVWPMSLDPTVDGRFSRVMILDSNGSTELMEKDYNSVSGALSFEINGTAVGSDLVVLALRDPELDSDNDGVPDVSDEFPLDPHEWRDLDGDGVGDNSDEDDDGDGFPDSLELEAGTDPNSTSSRPKDTDGDGILDYLDEDDNQNGIPDEWELRYSLNPLDPSDASEDPDGDGFTNLEEYERNSNPFDPASGSGGNGELPLWLILLILVLLVSASAVALLLVFASRRLPPEPTTEEEDWSIRGELDPEDAVECPGCSRVYPLLMDECPFCGEENPFNEDVE